MKSLILCCDGTWNSPDQKQNDIPAPTNVVRFYNTLAPRDAAGREQRKYYHPGVGTDGTKLERLGGGAYGLGISRNIMSAYRWLADVYEPGDAIYLFGFSRGAYTARSLAGFIGCCGLADLRGLSPADVWKRIEQAYNSVYRETPAKRPPVTWPVLPVDAALGKIPIQFIGVWDTVGALGIPDDLALLNLFDSPSKWKFHDTTLGDNVRFARHAIAIDELRESFTPTFWTDHQNNVLNDGTRVRQLWFPGVHCDVGGGYAQSGLSDIALEWMITEAGQAGLAFQQSYRVQIKPDFQGLLHDSLGGAFKALHTRPRCRPELTPHSPDYHPSACQRDDAPPITQSPYHRPTVTLQVNQSSEPIEVYARNHWNETGLFLESGATYEFTATGEWLDKSIPCGPNGTTDGKFHLGEVVHLAGALLGKLEGGLRKLTDNPDADVIGTRRMEAHPWFALIGSIANDGEQRTTNPSPDGSCCPHQMFLIGAGPTRLTVGPVAAGYLYAFANDAWHFYDNNRGSVTLTVKRIA